MAIQKVELDPDAQSYADLAELDATANTKLNGIEANAKDDQSGAEIKTAYEAETNAYTDAKDTKLSGVEAGAKDDQTGNEIVTAIDAGTSSITREDAVDANSMDLVKTEPVVGEFKVKSIQRKSTGKVEVSYDDVPEA